MWTNKYMSVVDKKTCRKFGEKMWNEKSRKDKSERLKWIFAKIHIKHICLNKHYRLNCRSFICRYSIHNLIDWCSAYTFKAYIFPYVCIHSNFGSLISFCILFSHFCVYAGFSFFRSSYHLSIFRSLFVDWKTWNVSLVYTKRVCFVFFFVASRKNSHVVFTFFAAASLKSGFKFKTKPFLTTF